MKSIKGFSMVELLVVLAIVAIIATIAIPSYNGYVAKSRRVEGFDLLNTYYSSAMAVKGEFGRFPGNFVQTDFAPVGVLNYRVQVNDGNDIGIPLVDDGCVNTANGTPCTCTGTCIGFKTWSEPATLGAVGAVIGPIASGGAGLGVCGPVAALNTTDSTFSIRASAVINTRAATRDVIAMDELKQIQLCFDGAK